MLPSSPALRRRPRRRPPLMRLPLLPRRPREPPPARGSPHARRYPGDGRLLDGRAVVRNGDPQGQGDHPNARTHAHAAGASVRSRNRQPPGSGRSRRGAPGPSRHAGDRIVEQAVPDDRQRGGPDDRVIVDGISRVIKISGESLEEYQGGSSAPGPGWRPSGESSRRGIRS